jgi:uncharacterized damage-inducible protein DinB
MTALTTDELIAWVNETSRRWQAHLIAHPQVLELDCDIREGARVRDLVHHIVAVELRYAERLNDLPISSYDAVPNDTVDHLYDTHARAMSLLQQAIAAPNTNWDEDLEFPTRSAGTLTARRRTIVVHMLMHSIRHYAQLGTIARHGGAAPDWLGDYLLMDLIR